MENQNINNNSFTEPTDTATQNPVKSLFSKKIGIGLFLFVAMLAAIPVTLNLIGQRQDLRQRASDTGRARIGEYNLSFTCTQGCTGVANHSMNITTVDDSGNFTGRGVSKNDSTRTWTITGSRISNDPSPSPSPDNPSPSPQISPESNYRDYSGEPISEDGSNSDTGSTSPLTGRQYNYDPLDREIIYNKTDYKADSTNSTSQTTGGEQEPIEPQEPIESEGNNISFIIVYTGTAAGYTVQGAGRINSSGIWSGTATAPGQAFTFTASPSEATPTGNQITATPTVSPTNGGVFKWTGTTWQSMNLNAANISVGPNGQAWAAAADGGIYKLTNNGWGRVLGAAKDIGVGPDGNPWVIGINQVTGGYSIHKWEGNTWILKPGGAVRIAVGPNGQAWIVNSFGNIFKWANNTWEQLPGAAKDIGVGADGSVWVIGTAPATAPTNYGIYKWTGTTWQQVAGGATRIAVGPDGIPYVVASGAIYKYKGNNEWTLLPGAGRDIGVGTDGTPWVIGTSEIAITPVSPSITISPTITTANPSPTPAIYNQRIDLNDDGLIEDLDLNLLYWGFSYRQGD